MHYLDHAATTPVCPEAAQAALEAMTQGFGNPSSGYPLGKAAAQRREADRAVIARALGCLPEELFFTSCGTEGDNWAIRRGVEVNRRRGRHIVTTAIEHHAVLHTCEYLEKRGYEVTYLDVDGEGMISPAALEKAIRPDTVLISVMAANNEIGTIQPVAKIGEIAHARGIFFHTDAVQAYGHVPLNVGEMHIDLLSASGHKLYGPKGVGILYIRENVRLQPLIHGGAQERGRRAGTLNVPGIVGFGKAAALAGETMQERAARETALRDYLIDRVLAEIPYTRLNGHRQDRLPGNAHFCFRFIEGESLLILLDQRGICGSSGSACTSGSLDPSHVLLAIGLPHETAHGSLRLTLSEETTKEDLDYVVDSLKEIVGTLRNMSPLYEDFIKKGNK